jgi:tetratricopeptide (TPR) repeat protein
MSRRNRNKRKAKQIVRGNYNAQASDHSSASVNVYQNVMPHPIEPAVIEAARCTLMSMPLEAPPGAGSLPLGSRPPAYARNLLFVGRENELRTIAVQFKEPARATVIITAMGGMGKTQLATEFVYRYGCYFAGGVFWLNFADPAAVQIEVTACSTAMQQELRSDVHTFPLDQQVEQVLAAWQSDLPRLLIFDNCEDEALLARWRPPVGNCRVLVTSRREERWSKELDVTLLPLHELPLADSVILLAKLAEYSSGRADSDLAAIAHEVGHLPLALVLAGKYLRTYRGSSLGTPTAYLAALRKGPLIDHSSFKGEDILYDTGHTRHLARTFAISYERLNVSDPIDQSALTLLACVACLAPGEPIPGDLLRAAVMMMKVEAKSVPGDSLAQTLLENADQLEGMSVQALQRLSDLGLLERHTEGVYRMHRLLHFFIHRQAADDPQVQVAVETVTLTLVHTLNEAHYFEEVRLLLPHLRALLQQSLSHENRVAMSLRAQLATYLHKTGAYQEAEFLYKETLAMSERVLGKNDLNTARSLNNLAELYREQSRYQEAEPLMQEALTIRERILGKEHPETALSLNSLAGLYHALGEYNKAEQLSWEALKVTVQALGEECAETANILNSLGFLCGVQKKYKETESLFKRSLGIWEQIRGREHTDTARTILNMAKLYCEQRRYSDAEPLMQEALRIWSKVLGATHPESKSTRQLSDSLPRARPV